MSVKKTLFVAALAFWAGVHYSPKFYEELEKREEDVLEDERVDVPWATWDKAFANIQIARAKLLNFYPSNDPTENEPMPLAQSEADKLYRFAFDKGWKSASEDKANIGKQYQKLFGTVTAEEVQSEMRGG